MIADMVTAAFSSFVPWSVINRTSDQFTVLEKWKEGRPKGKAFHRRDNGIPTGILARSAIMTTRMISSKKLRMSISDANMLTIYQFR